VPTLIGIVSLAGAAAAVVSLTFFGRSFLPEFNEGSLNIAAATAPGTSLETSNAIVGRLERYLVEHPAVTSVIRSTGRAERDEHALDVNFSELEVGLDLEGRDREELLEQIRTESASIPGLAVTVGQPISHRIEHLVSGVRASLAFKIYGDDLDQLRTLARQAEVAMKAVPGVVDVTVEQQTEIPEIVILPRATEAASFGKTPGELSSFVETALVGTKVGTYYERGRVYDVLARLPAEYGSTPDRLASIPIDADGERFTELGAIAQIDKTLGPNLINHEKGQRRIIVTANVTGRDMRGAAEDVLRATKEQVALPPGYRTELGGQFESEASASRTIVLLSGVAVLGIVLLLYAAFKSWRDALIVLFNLPLALVGGAVAVYLGGGVLSVASLVGFITLFGIATRNGIMMITHYRQLLDRKGNRGRRWCAGQPGPAGAHPDDGADRGDGADPDRARHRGAGERDPGADGGGHPGRAHQLHAAQPAGHSPAVRALREPWDGGGPRGAVGVVGGPSAGEPGRRYGFAGSRAIIRLSADSAPLPGGPVYE
jgi:Cu/Ag efflux pump CusA